MKTKMSPPWIEYLNELEVMFGDDPEINIDYDGEKYKIIMRIDNTDKADALTNLLPAEIEYGGVKLTIVVVPANNEKKSKADLIERALRGNPHYSQVIKVTDALAPQMTYVMFKKQVAQYWSDNLGDPHGNITTLYQDIAKDLFGTEVGVFYCTEPEEE